MSGTQPVPPVTPNESINTYGRIVVSVVIVAAFFVVLALSFTKTIPNDTTTTYLISTLGSLASAVVYYWVGSSASSATHSATIDKLASNAQNANTAPAPVVAPTQGPTP